MIRLEAKKAGDKAGMSTAGEIGRGTARVDQPTLTRPDKHTRQKRVTSASRRTSPPVTVGRDQDMSSLLLLRSCKLGSSDARSLANVVLSRSVLIFSM